MLLRMAWRNLWRSRRRTLITLASVGLGVWLAVTFIGMAHWSYGSMIDASARQGYGHVTVWPEGYGLAPSLKLRLADAEALRARVLGLPGVDDATARIAGQAIFATASRSVGGAFFAIDPRRESASNNLFLKSIVEGEVFAEPGARGAVIGRVMAERLGLRIGKKLVVTAVDVHGEIVSEMARVSAIFDSGVDDVDGSIVVLPIDLVRAALGYDAGAATMVSVYAASHRDSAEVAAAVSGVASRPGVEVLDWEGTQPELAGTIALDASTNYILQLLLGLLVAAGVLNTMLMSVLERQREFGVMLALGVTPGQLTGLVLVESVLVGLVGAALGGLVSVPWYVWMRRVGIDLSESFGEMDAGGVLMDPVLHLDLTVSASLAILAGVIALTALAGIYPAVRAGRQVPVESLKAL